MSKGHDSRTIEASRGARMFLRIQRVLLLAVVAWCLVVEVGLRIIAYPERVRADAPTSSVPHPYLGATGRPGWRSEDARIVHDERGFRVTGTAPIADAYRIVCLGGAATYGAGCSSNETTWPARLGVALAEQVEGAAGSVDIVNAGFPGWTSFEVALDLAFRVIDLEPDLVVLQVGADDVVPALFGDPTGDNTHWRTVWRISRPSPLEAVLDRSVTYRLARRLFSSGDEPHERDRAPSVTDQLAGGEDPLRVEGFGERGVLNFERNLRTAIGIAREHGIEVVLLPQFVDHTRVENRPSGSNQLRLSLELALVTERIAEELGVKRIDIDPALVGDGSDDVSAGRIARAVAAGCAPLVAQSR